MLIDYPECIDRLQATLDWFAETSSAGLDPYDRAIWLLEGCLETFISEAREEIEAAKRAGDQTALEAAHKRALRMSHAGAGMGGMEDSLIYIQRTVEDSKSRLRRSQDSPHRFFGRTKPPLYLTE